MPVVVYKNTSKKSLNVIGIGEIKAGEQVSLSGQYLPQIILENYPGLVDITDVSEEPQDEQVVKAA